jgi:hypothetical protein
LHIGIFQAFHELAAEDFLEDFQTEERIAPTRDAAWKRMGMPLKPSPGHVKRWTGHGEFKGTAFFDARLGSRTERVKASDNN